MKFLCVPCDTPMKLQTVVPPDRGSLSVVYACPECGYEIAMLTNAYETQVVQSLGVRIGPGLRADAAMDEHGRAAALHQAGGEPPADAPGVGVEGKTAGQANLPTVGVAGEDQVRAGPFRVREHVGRVGQQDDGLPLMALRRGHRGQGPFYVGPAGMRVVHADEVEPPAPFGHHGRVVDQQPHAGPGQVPGRPQPLPRLRLRPPSLHLPGLPRVRHREMAGRCTSPHLNGDRSRAYVRDGPPRRRRRMVPAPRRYVKIQPWL